MVKSTLTPIGVMEAMQNAFENFTLQTDLQGFLVKCHSIYPKGILL